MPPICSPLVRPGRPAEAAPVVSKQLSDTILRHVKHFSVRSLLLNHFFKSILAKGITSVFCSNLGSRGSNNSILFTCVMDVAVLA